MMASFLLLLRLINCNHSSGIFFTDNDGYCAFFSIEVFFIIKICLGSLNFIFFHMIWFFLQELPNTFGKLVSDKATKEHIVLFDPTSADRQRTN